MPGPLHPGFIPPCLADRVPAGSAWVHEIKHDGYRFICRRDGDRVRVFSRRGLDWTARVSAIVDAMLALRVRKPVPRYCEAVLDDEAARRDPGCHVSSRTCNIEVESAAESVKDVRWRIPFIRRPNRLLMQCHYLPAAFRQRTAPAAAPAGERKDQAGETSERVGDRAPRGQRRSPDGSWGNRSPATGVPP